MRKPESGHVCLRRDSDPVAADLALNGLLFLGTNVSTGRLGVKGEVNVWGDRLFRRLSLVWS